MKEVSEIAKTVASKAMENSPVILTSIAVVGVLSTTITAVRATPKALKLIEDEERKAEAEFYEQYENYVPDWPGLSKMDILRVAWKPYIPSLLLGGATVACIIGANSINLRRNAALASVYSLTERTLKEYQSKVVETLGEKKEEKIREDILQDRIDKNPVSKNEIIMTGKGETLCYDSVSGRYFKCDLEKIRRVENDLNHELMSSMWVALNDFYYVLGLDPISVGDDLGWSIDELINIHIGAKVTDEGEPCIVLDYQVTNRKH